MAQTKLDDLELLTELGGMREITQPKLSATLN